MGRCDTLQQQQDTANETIIRVGGTSWFNRAVFLTGAIVDYREINWEYESKAAHLTYNSKAQGHWQVSPAPDDKYWVMMLSEKNDCTHSSSTVQWCWVSRLWAAAHHLISLHQSACHYEMWWRKPCSSGLRCSSCAVKVRWEAQLAKLFLTIVSTCPPPASNGNFVSGTL